MTGPAESPQESHQESHQDAGGPSEAGEDVAAAAFDRLRRRTPAAPPGEAPGRAAADTRPIDRRGKRALYSDVTAPPTVGSVALTCSRCDARSVVSWLRAARLAFPSLFVPVPGDGMRCWMRCPACRKRTWLLVSLRG